MTPQEAEVALATDIAGFTHDPLGYAKYAFEWGKGVLKDAPGPRTWQCDVLDDIGRHLRDPATRHMPCRVAVASGHGIGKSALISMVTKWGLDTCEDTRVVITANTEKQLVNKTWPEITKWAQLALTRDWFTPTATAVYSNEAGHDKAWRADAVTWSKENTEAFAGLHNQGKRIIVIFDEASAIEDKVWEVTEGALTDENTEIIWIAFGNPTRASGRFRECFRKFKALWKTRQIDSRTVEGTNKAQLAEWAETYKEDSDWYKVRVRGLFPNLSMRQFIGEDDIDAAYGRHLRPEQYQHAPKILACDPAWEGDDTLEIGIRQGLYWRHLLTIPKNDNDGHVASILARFEDEHEADAVFIDKGYGTGIYSFGQTMGRDWMLVDFGAAAPDTGYKNMRAWIWGQMRDWLKAGGAIPDDPQMRDELLAPETVPRPDGVIQLESKKDMKKRGVASPNKADALAITFAYPVNKKGARRAATPQETGSLYDPYA